MFGEFLDTGNKIREVIHDQHEGISKMITNIENPTDEPTKENPNPSPIVAIDQYDTWHGKSVFMKAFLDIVFAKQEKSSLYCVTPMEITSEGLGLLGRITLLFYLEDMNVLHK